MPFLPLAALAAAAVFGTRWMRKEWRRINAELDAVRPTEAEQMTLRRDPETGDWRPTR
jgi:hypothetical protein